jgi:hypothetical protein
VAPGQLGLELLEGVHVLGVARSLNGDGRPLFAELLGVLEGGLLVRAVAVCGGCVWWTMSQARRGRAGAVKGSKAGRGLCART